MLQKAFFKVDVVDRIYDTPVFEKTTPGAYEFTVPEEYNYVVIEYAGGAGGGIVGSGALQNRNGGKGSIKSLTISITSRKIIGIVGQAGKNGGIGSAVPKGGTGNVNGENGTQGDKFLSYYVYSGAGGGSTSVQINQKTYEASAGGGGFDKGAGSYGGKGGGVYGGARQTSYANGNNATDPNQTSLNSGDGYVKIWAGYDPYFNG